MRGPTWLWREVCHLVCDISGCGWSRDVLPSVCLSLTACALPLFSRLPSSLLCRGNEPSMDDGVPIHDNHKLHPRCKYYLKEMNLYSRPLSQCVREAGGNGQDLHTQELSSLRRVEMVGGQQARKIKGLSEPPAQQLEPCLQGL